MRRRPGDARRAAVRCICELFARNESKKSGPASPAHSVELQLVPPDAEFRALQDRALQVGQKAALEILGPPAGLADQMVVMRPVLVRQFEALAPNHMIRGGQDAELAE